VDGLVYLKSTRKLTDEEIKHWHILTKEDEVQFPVIDYAGKYCFTVKRLLSGKRSYDYPSDAPVGFRLFGLDHAVQPIVEEGCAIIVEGPFDVIAMHSIGFTNTVGALSNNLTRWQALQLRRWTNRLVFVLDGDDGGREGLKQTVKVLQANFDFTFTAVKLSTGDPDSYVRTGAIKPTLLKAVGNAIKKVRNNGN